MDEQELNSNTPETGETPPSDAGSETPAQQPATPQGSAPPSRSGAPRSGGGGAPRGSGQRRGGGGGGEGRSRKGPGTKDQKSAVDRNAPAGDADADRVEWKEKVIQIRRVTKVVKGGKKLSFRAVVVVGNGAGQVGIGIGKSNEVIGAIQKGVAAAKKTLITVPLHNTTIPHAVKAKAGGSVVMLRPASKGTGVIAGGAARALLELAGVENILSKSLGSNSPLNVARATLQGLSELRSFRSVAESRGLTVGQMLGTTSKQA